MLLDGMSAFVFTFCCYLFSFVSPCKAHSGSRSMVFGHPRYYQGERMLEEFDFANLCLE